MSMLTFANKKEVAQPGYDPDDALAHANLGKLYEDQGLWNEALQEGSKAAKLDRRVVIVLLGLTKVWLSMKQENFYLRKDQL